MQKRNDKTTTRRTSLSRASNFEELVNYWDAHDLADVWDQTQAVKADVRLVRRRYLVAIESDVLRGVRQLARRRKVSYGTLINRLLRERLAS
jgi:CopG antitoxin of type II toxin-antitoxin system